MTDKKFLIKLFAIATSFIYEAIAAIALGYLIGLGLDRLFKLDTIFTIIFMIIGALAAVRNVMVRAYKLGAEKDDSNKN
ncbi:MAG: AtpZ/AtpI family protein [Candidatus Izemoplasmataceae bacterium]|jgi:F0F1-type ATP synthase assembly protein I|uniref:AtpZ/AtpI family protein n=1 Tax=Liberiplasma polymorphum TaxID=3374570 RepID=UPI0037763C25